MSLPPSVTSTSNGLCCSSRFGRRCNAASLVSPLTPPLTTTHPVLRASRSGHASSRVTPAPWVRLSPSASTRLPAGSACSLVLAEHATIRTIAATSKTNRRRAQFLEMVMACLLDILRRVTLIVRCKDERLRLRRLPVYRHAGRGGCLLYTSDAADE